MAPPYMGIYKDIQDHLKEKGYQVDCIVRPVDERDPFYTYRSLNKVLYSKNKYLKSLENFWRNTLGSEEYKKTYDYLFVINGTFVHPVLFGILKERNQDVKCVNYLVDSLQIYEFDRNFPYYDKIYSFDRRDALKHHIELLPIYWIPDALESSKEDTLDVFAMGGFKNDRYFLFDRIKDLSDKYGLNSYIKIFLPQDSRFVHRIVQKLRSVVILRKWSLDSDIIINESLPPDTFRKYISSSRVVVDTILKKQVGLTSRLVWAVGMGKKVITTNDDIVNYPFYNPSRFFIVKDLSVVIPKEFFLENYSENKDERAIIDQYRIDNWLDYVLS